MLPSEERDVSLSMLRFWGQGAAEEALGYAQQHAKLGNDADASRWHNVARLIVQIREAANYASQKATA
jgi:hypothetical protein